MLKELLITIATLQLDTVSATLMLLETAAMLVSLEHSISQLVKVIEAVESTLHSYTAQCFYREGRAYIVKNPMVCLICPAAKFL